MQGITNKTDKQLLKESKLELLGYIRELEAIITDHECEVVVSKTEPTKPTSPQLTTYSFSETSDKKGLYKF